LAFSRLLCVSGSEQSGLSSSAAAGSGRSTQKGGEKKDDKLHGHTAQPKRGIECEGSHSASASKRPRKAEAKADEPALPESSLSFADVRGLKHAVLAHKVAEEPEVVLWNADVIAADEQAQTLDVRIREWRLLVRGVKPTSLFRPSASLPAV
jgi:hypothetical protein